MTKTFLDRKTVQEIMDANKRKVSLENFEDIYNPLKVYARLRDLEIPQESAKQLSIWYEDIFYKQVMDRVKR